MGTLKHLPHAARPLVPQRVALWNFRHLIFCVLWVWTDLTGKRVSLLLSTGVSASRGVVYIGGSASSGVYIRGLGWAEPSPPPEHYRIRSTSGRYASYWNAFLLILKTELWNNWDIRPVWAIPHRRRPRRSSANRKHEQLVTRYSNHSNCNHTSSSASVMDAASSVICASKPSEPSVRSSLTRRRHYLRLSEHSSRIHTNLVSIMSIFLRYHSKYLVNVGNLCTRKAGYYSAMNSIGK